MREVHTSLAADRHYVVGREGRDTPRVPLVHLNPALAETAIWPVLMWLWPPLFRHAFAYESLQAVVCRLPESWCSKQKKSEILLSYSLIRRMRNKTCP